MSSISSNDCKIFLEKTFPFPAKGWKRMSKKKDPSGRVVREFHHPEGGVVFLAEQNDALVDVTPAFAAPAQQRAPGIARWVFGPVERAAAQRLFDDAVERACDALDPAAAGYHAIPGVFSFAFMDEAGDQYEAVEAIVAAQDPQAIVTGLTVFITPLDHDYGCNHLAWALTPFLPAYMEEVEESSFALYVSWAHVAGEERADAVASGRIPSLPLMEVMRDLLGRGFHYNPEQCVFGSMLGKTIGSSLFS